MRILYGIINNYIDVTDVCLERLTKNDIITIPFGDLARSKYFSDPLHGTVKKIIIENNDSVTEYDIFTLIKINIVNKTITTVHDDDITIRTQNIQSKLKIDYGSFHDELPEQKMVVRYLTGNEKVLEIGGNIGRNSMIIASILTDTKNLVTLECDETIAKQLTENRDLNGLQFNIENSALSNRKLIQRSWETEPSETLKEGFNWVNTITLEDLKSKFHIEFDTLVLDCEGAFYYILMDMPEILNNIKLIIMENDYWDISHKNYIDGVLNMNGFNVDYIESGGWGPCYDNFFEVWKRIE